MSTPILTVPNEILFIIAKLLPRRYVAALLKTCRDMMYPFHAFLVSQYKNDILLFAACTNRLEQLQLALSAGADLSYSGKVVGSNYTRPALHWAAAGGHTTIITELIRHKAPLEDIDDSGFTPLLKAAGRGHQEAVDLLLAAGADPTARSGEDGLLSFAIQRKLQPTVIAYIHLMNNYALIMAFTYNELGIARLMFERGIADTVTPPIQSAVLSGLEFVKLCVEFGADVNSLGSVGRDLDGDIDSATTALSVAARNGWIDIMEYLLDLGADVNLPTNEIYHRPIVLATHRGHTAAVSLLLQHGVDLVGLGRDGGYLVTCACVLELTELARILLDAFEACNIDVLRKSRAIRFAAHSPNPDLVKLLVAHGAEIDDKALEFAVAARYFETAQALVEGGATISTLDTSSREAYEMWVSGQHGSD